MKALKLSRIHASDNSVFSTRLEHYAEEKEYLAEQFVPLLLERCKVQIEHARKVFLVIDSGTTLLPVFEHLGRQTAMHKDETWLTNLTIVTNSLSGVMELMNYGRINPGDEYSNLAVTTQLLPGAPIPIYEAVTGDETNSALSALREHAEGAYFIGLLSGNWIRFRRKEPVCPVPLARGKGHQPYKQCMVANSDEIYVIAPLGKIFFDVPPDAINDTPGLGDWNHNPYKEVEIYDDKPSVVKIVSTYREKTGSLLHVHGEMAKERLRADLAFSPAEIKQLPEKIAQHGKIPNIFYPYDLVHDDLNYQLRTEFPHSNTRKRKLLSDFFHVTPKHLDSLRL